MGNTNLHETLERKIASFKGTEAAVLFNTGYTANTAIIAALADKESIVFSDEFNHASIIDGCRLSRAKVVIYRHNDMADLEAKIRENPCANGLVVSDAVFSMDGDILQFPRFLDICEKHDLLSMIDEAHSTGVLGEHGHGIQEHFHESRYPDILMGTLSKAVGAEGGYAACSQLLADYLRNTARGFIFSTAMSPVTAQAALTGLELIEREPERVQQLHRNIACFCEALREGGLNVSSETPIIPIVIGDEGRALAVAQQLYEAGILIPAIRYPTVAKWSARLRVSLMATHTEEELRRAAVLICQAIS
jgi:6-carboxyhexanoate--CoA ligase